MAPKILPSQAYLRECFDYDPATGKIRWKERPLFHFSSRRYWRMWNTKFPGKFAGWWWKGNLFVAIEHKQYRGARLIYKLQTGKDPIEVDHRDHDPTNNRWSNLRPATHLENTRNRRVLRRARLRGSYPHHQRFAARITIRGVQTYIGLYSTEGEAHAAFCDYARRHYGEFWHCQNPGCNQGL